MVDWIVGDGTTDLLPDCSTDLRHDRAVFHFLTDEAARSAYLSQVMRCVKSGGHVLVETFAFDGPEKCSGLPVARYDTDGIHAAFGASLDKVGEAAEIHETPLGRGAVVCLLLLPPGRLTCWIEAKQSSVLACSRRR